MSATIRDQFFDLSMRVLNYAIEFVNSPGYASLRMVDVLQGLVGLSLQLEGVSNKEFYRRLQEKLGERRLLSDSEKRSAFLDEVLAMFIDEWRKPR